MRRHDIISYVKKPNGDFHDPADVLALVGPCINVVVAQPPSLTEAIAKQGAPTPQPIPVRAVIDTGCTRTAIDTRLVKRLGLPQTGAGKTQTANGPVDTTLHPVHIFFPDLKAGQLLPQASACDLAGSAFGVLLGTDVLRSFVMIYDGPSGRVTLIN